MELPSHFLGVFIFIPLSLLVGQKLFWAADTLAGERRVMMLFQIKKKKVCWMYEIYCILEVIQFADVVRVEGAH